MDDAEVRKTVLEPGTPVMVDGRVIGRVRSARYVERDRCIVAELVVDPNAMPKPVAFRDVFPRVEPGTFRYDPAQLAAPVNPVPMKPDPDILRSIHEYFDACIERLMLGRSYATHAEMAEAERQRLAAAMDEQSNAVAGKCPGDVGHSVVGVPVTTYAEFMAVGCADPNPHAPVVNWTSTAPDDDCDTPTIVGGPSRE